MPERTSPTQRLPKQLVSVYAGEIHGLNGHGGAIECDLLNRSGLASNTHHVAVAHYAITTYLPRGYDHYMAKIKNPISISDIRKNIEVQYLCTGKDVANHYLQ